MCACSDKGGPESAESNEEDGNNEKSLEPSRAQKYEYRMGEGCF